jgi:hypothetical protein
MISNSISKGMNFKLMTAQLPVPVLLPVPVTMPVPVPLLVIYYACLTISTSFNGLNYFNIKLNYCLHPIDSGGLVMEQNVMLVPVPVPVPVPVLAPRNLTSTNPFAASERDLVLVENGALGPVPVPVPEKIVFISTIIFLIFTIPFAASERDRVLVASGALGPVPVLVPGSAKVVFKSTIIILIFNPRPCLSMEGDLIDLREPGDFLPGARHSDPAPTPPTQIETDFSGTPNLGNVFKQCKLAKQTGISIQNTVFGTGNECNYAPAKPARIGTIDMPGDAEVLNTFHGARICSCET